MHLATVLEHPPGRITIGDVGIWIRIQRIDVWVNAELATRWSWAVGGLRSLGCVHRHPRHTFTYRNDGERPHRGDTWDVYEKIEAGTTKYLMFDVVTVNRNTTLTFPLDEIAELL